MIINYFSSIKIFVRELYIALVQSFFTSKIHPLFFSTLSLLLGISYQAEKISLPYCVLSLLILWIAIFKSYVNWKNIFLLSLICFSGGMLRVHYSKQVDISFWNQLPEKIHYVEGKIEEIKIKLGTAFSYQIDVNLLYLKRVEAQAVSYRGKIKLYTKYNPNFLPGDIVRIYYPAFKKQPINNSFNYFLLKQGVSATFFSYDANTRLLHRPKWSFKRWIYKKKILIRDSINQKMSFQTAALFNYLFLGVNEQKREDTQIAIDIDTIRAVS